MGADIFISFASQDRRVAMTLCAALENRGFKCWISSRDIPPGENFQIAIVHAIRKAKIMLLVFTANSNNSDEMSKELALASQNRLMVVPLRIEDVAPNDAFAYEFATRQWIDFFADWEMAIQQLAERISYATGITAGVAEGPVAPPAETRGKAPPAEFDPEPEPASAPEDTVEALPVEAAREPRSFDAESEAAGDDAAMVDAEAGERAGISSRRLGIYAALSVIVLLIVGAGLIAPGLRRMKPSNPEVRAMVVIPAPPPSDLQKASAAVPAAAEATAPTDQPVVKLAKHKRAARAKAEDSDVPY